MASAVVTEIADPASPALKAKGASRRPLSAFTKKNNLFLTIGPPNRNPYWLSVKVVYLASVSGLLPTKFSFLIKV